MNDRPAKSKTRWLSTLFSVLGVGMLMYTTVSILALLVTLAVEAVLPAHNYALASGLSLNVGFLAMLAGFVLGYWLRPRPAAPRPAPAGNPGPDAGPHPVGQDPG